MKQSLSQTTDTRTSAAMSGLSQQDAIDVREIVVSCPWILGWFVIRQELNDLASRSCCWLSLDFWFICYSECSGKALEGFKGEDLWLAFDQVHFGCGERPEGIQGGGQETSRRPVEYSGWGKMTGGQFSLGGGVDVEVERRVWGTCSIPILPEVFAALFCEGCDRTPGRRR